MFHGSNYLGSMEALSEVPISLFAAFIELRDRAETLGGAPPSPPPPKSTTSPRRARHPTRHLSSRREPPPQYRPARARYRPNTTTERRGPARPAFARTALARHGTCPPGESPPPPPRNYVREALPPRVGTPQLTIPTNVHKG